MWLHTHHQMAQNGITRVAVTVSARSRVHTHSSLVDLVEPLIELVKKKSQTVQTYIDKHSASDYQ